MNSFFRQSLVWDYFENTPGSQHVYGLTGSATGAVLAFTEARIIAGDHSPHHLVMKRGTFDSENKMVWSKNIFIERGDDGTSWANPAALTDSKNNRIFIFYVINNGQLEQLSTKVFYRESEDEGFSWGPRREITSLFSKYPYGWSFHMPGPGHGIQLKNQPMSELNGRLLVQFWHRRAINNVPRKYGVSVIYSDDHGKSWRCGGTTGAILNMNESRLVETNNGKIVLNTKGQDIDGINNHHNRFTAFSEDGGLTFSKPAVCSNFEYCGCDSGILNLNFAGKELLLLSHPTKPNRKCLGISVSQDNGISWQYLKTIFDGQCQYSDMNLLADGSIGLLYGIGTDAEQKSLFANFSPEWLFNISDL